MLSERQIQALIHEINEDVNIPFIGEAKEGEIIEKYVRRVVPQVLPSLEATVGSIYANAMAKALDDDSTLDNRRREISSSLKDELGGPIADIMNEYFDATLLTEEMESKILRFTVDKLLSQFVIWVIGELDEQVEESLAEAEEARLDSERLASFSLDDAADALFLSERELQAMTIEINEDINLPFVSEAKEGDMIRGFLDKINPHLGGAFEKICGSLSARCVRTALDEGVPLRERRKRITKLLRDELSGPLSRELNERVDSSMLTESMEGQALEVAVDKMIKQCVKMVVGEIDERIEESLAKGGALCQ